MIPILRDHPDDKEKAQLFWDGKEHDLPLIRCIQWQDTLNQIILRALLEKIRNEKLKQAPVEIEGWGIFP